MNRPAAKVDREQFPNLQEDIGEDPARFLDRELLGTDYGDGNVAALTKARIRGIDEIAVARAWIGVERRLERGPRDPVIALLEDRIDYLQEHGEREDQLATAVDPDDFPSTESVVEWADRDGERSGTHMQAGISRELATDGGEQR